jgi:hypothetical protein
VTDNRSRIPKVVALPAPDELRRMPLTPVDGFVLSRVDGRSSEDDLVTATGLAPDQVRASLDRLAGLSLVSLGDSPARSGVRQSVNEPRPVTPVTPAGRASAAQSGTRMVVENVATPPTAAPAVTPTVTATGAGAAAGVDLTPEEQLRILDVHVRLDTIDHYALLGVSRAAERKEIKRAYYERAALFHPDRYFRRNVGTFKAKLEAVFAKVTLAHDVLTDKVQRAEYDTYLGDVARARDLEARVEQAEATVREAEAAASAAPAPPPSGASSPAERLVTPVTNASHPISSIPAAAPISSSRPGEPRRPSRPIAPIDPRARRDLLAKHLIGGRTAPSIPGAPLAAAPPASDPDALRRHFDQRKADVVRAQALRHKSAGDQALAAGDMIAAASSYRAALTFLPNDAELVRLHDAAQKDSFDALAETYRKQGSYEEKSGRWPDAAKSWLKLADLVPKDAEAQERAGNAILQAKGSLHDAATYAQRAVTLQPENARYRTLLATIYLEAGLLKNARREIDAAEQIAPGDVIIAALAKRLANATGR